MSSRYSYFRPMDESDLDWVMSVETAAYDFPWSRQGFEKPWMTALVMCSVMRPGNHWVMPVSYRFWTKRTY